MRPSATTTERVAIRAASSTLCDTINSVIFCCWQLVLTSVNIS